VLSEEIYHVSPYIFWYYIWNSGNHFSAVAPSYTRFPKFTFGNCWNRTPCPIRLHQSTVLPVLKSIARIKDYLLIVQSVTWKRYNDFKKLHKAMFSLHKALHRREEFPPFVKAQLFSE